MYIICKNKNVSASCKGKTGWREERLVGALPLAENFWLWFPNTDSKTQAEKKDDLTFLSLFTLMKKQLTEWERNKLCNQRFISQWPWTQSRKQAIILKDEHKTQHKILCAQNNWLVKPNCIVEAQSKHWGETSTLWAKPRSCGCVFFF